MPQAKTDLELAYDALTAKRAKYDLLWSYYDGPHPLVYSTRRLREIFGRIDARFTQNWAAVVVDSTLDRVNLQRFVVQGNKEATEEINDLWLESQMQLDSDDAHKAALVCGEAFVIAWHDPDDASITEAYYNDPRLVHIFYETDKPRKKRFAAKWWVDDNKKRRIVLYYPDRFEYYVSRKNAENMTKGTPEEFRSAGQTEINDKGEVPVFHLRRERRKIESELANVIEPNDAVNKLCADMMVSAEFAAMKQRYVISSADNIGSLKNAPNEVWDLPAGDGDGQGTEVGELSATELKNYIDAIGQWTSALAIISRTPKHYFFQQGGDPSGEALIAMEAPLNKKAASYIERWEVTWQEIAAFMLRLKGGATVKPTAITAVFAKPETVQPLTQSNIRNNERTAGIPLKTSLKREGWSDEEIEQMQKDKDEEDAAQQKKDDAAGKTELGQRIRERRAAAELAK